MNLSLLGLALLLPHAPNSSERAAEPVRLIFDTDIGNDVDDALALALIHALESRRACKLLAVTVTKDSPLAAPFVDAINTFYGRPEVPIGAVRQGVTPDEGRYLGLVRQGDGGHPRYPYRLKSGDDAPDAVALLRRILADQPDGSVVIAQVGFATNLARLLSTPPDAVSSLSGAELAARKVKFVSAMFGAFRPVGGRPHPEYNVVTDLPSAKVFVDRWPTPIVFSPFEVGLAVTYPGASIDRDYAYVAHHPIAEAYRLYEPPPHDRPCWDLTSVIYAVAPDRDDFGLSERGRVRVDDRGVTTFAPEPEGKHRYLTMGDQQAVRLREAFVQLCSQPPTPRQP